MTPPTVMVMLRKTVASMFTGFAGGFTTFKEKGAGLFVMGKVV